MEDGRTKVERNMTEAESLSALPKSTILEKLTTLETKFAALEKKYTDLHVKTVTPVEQPTAKSPEFTILPLSPVNGTKNEEATPQEEESGPKSRAKILVNRLGTTTGERKDYLPSDQSAVKSQVTDASHAFTLRRFVYDDSEQNEGEIDILSLGLWELLKSLLGHYPYHVFRGSPTTLHSPYEPLVLNWDKLDQVAMEKPEDAKDEQARSDLKLLLDTIASSSGDTKLDKYFKVRDSNKEQKSVTFETLWTIFSPGTLIYGRPFQDQDQVFVVRDNAETWPFFRRGLPREQASWTLVGWSYDWDGKKFKRLCLKMTFDYFDGTKPITSLPYFPFHLHDQRDIITEKLLTQGVKYQQFCTAYQGARLFEYSGNALFVKKGFSGVQGDDDRDDDGLSRSSYDPEVEFFRRLKVSRKESNGSDGRSVNVDSRVMVDFESYFLYGPSVACVGPLMPYTDHPECGCNDCLENEGLKAGYRTRFDEETHQRGKWEDEQYLLCPPRVLGYILRDKQWAQLQVSELGGIPDNSANDSWTTRLKLADGEKTKRMISDLVKGHGSSDSSQDDGLEVDDIIARKGKGLVMLLYDFRLGDILAGGSFFLAVLMHGTRLTDSSDEADVFLESRGRGLGANTEKNALVSVFLRVLEYYQGILILTTNQIAQFDVAVQSRVHVAIKYTNLNTEQTMSIFEGFFRPLAEQGRIKGMDDIKEWLEEDVVKKGLDGRQIRNIITSALGLARAQGKTRLEKSHIKTMLSNVEDFKVEFIKQFEKYKSEQQGMIG